MVPLVGIALGLVLPLLVPPELAVQARIKTGIQPKSVSVSPYEDRVAICNFGQAVNRNVVIRDATTLDRLVQVDFRGTATESTWRDSIDLLVSDFANGELLVIDSDAGIIVDHIKVGPNPKGIALSPDGRLAFVTNWSNRSISVVDLDEARVVQTLKTGRRPRGVAVTDEAVLVVGAMWDHELHFFDPMGEHAYDAHPFEKRACSYPRDVVMTPDGRHIAVTCSGNQRLRWYDHVTRRLAGQAMVGENPRSLAISRQGAWAAVANYYGDSVTLVDLSSGETSTTAFRRVEGIVGVAMAGDVEPVVYATSFYTNELLRLTVPRPGGG